MSEYVFYHCTHCEWLGTLDDAEQDTSVAEQGELCPECFSHIEVSADDGQVVIDLQYTANGVPVSGESL